MTVLVSVRTSGSGRTVIVVVSGLGVMVTFFVTVVFSGSGVMVTVLVSPSVVTVTVAVAVAVGAVNASSGMNASAATIRRMKPPNRAPRT